MSDTNKIVYRIAVHTDREQIREHLRTFFYPDDPLTIEHSPKCDEEYTLSLVDTGASMVAIDASNGGKLVGVILTGPMNSKDADLGIAQAKKYEAEYKKWSQMLILLATLQKNLFERLKIKETLHIHMMSVDRACRGKKIGIQLLLKFMELAKTLGFQIISTDCTSHYSTKVATIGGMECVHTMAYSDYKDDAGRQIFCPPSPHTEIKSFVKKL